MATKTRCCDRSREKCCHLMNQSSLETQTAVYLGDMAHIKPKSRHSMRASNQSTKALSKESICLNMNGGEIIEQPRDDRKASHCSGCGVNGTSNGDDQACVLIGQLGRQSQGHDGQRDGEDEHDGIVTDFRRHIRLFVGSVFGKTGCRGERVTNPILVPSPFQHGFRNLGIRIRQEEMGLRVIRVTTDSLACKAQIKKSDILTHLDDEELINRELDEIRGMFEGVQKTFKLTVLREIHEGDNIRQIQLTFKICITETVDRSFEIEVFAPFVRVKESTSKFITQDPDGGHQTYMHYDDDGSLYMRELNHQDQECVDRASFYFEFYHVHCVSHIQGQLCLIRHQTTNHGKRVFNCHTGTMESLRNQELRKYLMYRISTNDEKYKFRAFQSNGNQDRYLMNVDGKIALRSSQVQSDALFEIHDV